MILGVYAVKDKAVNAFMPPFFVRHRGEAIRSFTDACQTKDHQFNKHAHDYTLFEVGAWDDASGLLTACDPVRVLSGVEVDTAA